MVMLEYLRKAYNKKIIRYYLENIYKYVKQFEVILMSKYGMNDIKIDVRITCALASPLPLSKPPLVSTPIKVLFPVSISPAIATTT